MKKRKTPAWIQYKLKLKGLTQADVARSLAPPVHKNAVGQVVRGEDTSQRIMEKIAEVLGREFTEVWGE